MNMPGHVVTCQRHVQPSCVQYDSSEMLSPFVRCHSPHLNLCILCNQRRE